MLNGDDGPAGPLEELDEVALREPAQVRPVTVPGLAVAERPAQDQVARERPVARVRYGDVQPGPWCGDPAESAQERGRIGKVLEQVVAEDRVEPLVQRNERLLGPARHQGVEPPPSVLGRLRVELDPDQPPGTRST